MNKTQLVEAMAKKSGLNKKQAEAALSAFIDCVSETLHKKDKISLIGFGTFEATKRPARTARNPRTGEAMKIKASYVPKFKAGAGLKKAMPAK